MKSRRNLITEDEGVISGNPEKNKSTMSNFIYIPGTSDDENANY